MCSSPLENGLGGYRYKIGESFSRYIVEDQIGSGSFGRVYRAFDPFLERRVAIKVIDAIASDAEEAESWLAEGRSLANLDHPGVVPYRKLEPIKELKGIKLN